MIFCSEENKQKTTLGRNRKKHANKAGQEGYKQTKVKRKKTNSKTQLGRKETKKGRKENKQPNKANKQPNKARKEEKTGKHS